MIDVVLIAAVVVLAVHAVRTNRRLRTTERSWSQLIDWVAGVELYHRPLIARSQYDNLHYDGFAQFWRHQKDNPPKDMPIEELVRRTKELSEGMRRKRSG